MLPEEQARVKIDKQLTDSGWDVVSRSEYVPLSTAAVKEAPVQNRKETDYLLFADDKAIAVVEAKPDTNNLGKRVAQQAEWYATHPQSWYGVWGDDGFIPLIYLANGNKIYYKNMLKDPKGEYTELSEMHTPKKMLQLIRQKSEYGALPKIDKRGLRNCQYEAEVMFEQSLKEGKKRGLAVLATGAGKTYLACLASYRLLNYTSTNRVLFLVDRNNLGIKTESDFNRFKLTEKGNSLGELYQVKRLKNNDDVNANIVISTIQRFYARLTGQVLPDESEDDKEDEFSLKLNEKASAKQEVVKLENEKELFLAPDHFQFIVIDECHRSIYGKWRAVLDYFKDAIILGLTATPTEEAYDFFDKNIVESYSYEDSVIDGVNVPARVYRISTKTTVHGGTIKKDEVVKETTKLTDQTAERLITKTIDFSALELDRLVTVPKQIETVIKAYRDAIYTELYPDREPLWEYIPKTLIFAKDDNHATKIVEAVRKVFAEKYSDGVVPESFVQKITYTADNPNQLIREFRSEKEFRIAVTVTLVSTGTDIKPLEVVLFMNDVRSDLLYTQMKGRGCRTISDDALKEVTPNATTKECFYIVDAVGVTESDKTIPKVGGENKVKTLSLWHLLERLAHGEVSDDNLKLLRDYCSSINRRYENNIMFGRHLNEFIALFGFAPRTLAYNINDVIKKKSLPPFESVSDPNIERKELISCLVGNVDARKKLLEMQKGYIVIDPEPDEVLYVGFSRETAIDVISKFEKCLKKNKDHIEALRNIYNSDNQPITHSMLSDLKDKLASENHLFTPYTLWSSYKILDTEGRVEAFDEKHAKALTGYIPLVKYAFRKSQSLDSLYTGYSQRFNLYCGQAQRKLSPKQKETAKEIADIVISEGYISSDELNDVDTDLWRRAIRDFENLNLDDEIRILSSFILKERYLKEA